MISSVNLWQDYSTGMARNQTAENQMAKSDVIEPKPRGTHELGTGTLPIAAAEIG
jgi:hypothetical protein